MPIYTIDDYYGDERFGAENSTQLPYEPIDSWTTYGASGFQSVPDTMPLSDIHSGTFHAGYMKPGDPPVNVTVTFTGTWIGVYCILAAPIPGPSSTDPEANTVNLQFMLDGAVAGHYENSSLPQTAFEFQYNTTVFNSSTLTNGQHTLVVQLLAPNNASGVNLDYFAYNFDDTTAVAPSSLPGSSAQSTSSTSSTPITSSTQLAPTVVPVHRSRTNVGAAVGGSLGGATVVIVILIFVLWRRSSKKPASRVVPFDPASSAPLTITPQPDASITPFLAYSRRNGPDTLHTGSMEKIPEKGEVVATQSNSGEASGAFTPEQLRGPQSSMEGPMLAAAASGGSEPEVVHLRREIEGLRAHIQELHENVGFDEPPPTYVSEVEGANLANQLERTAQS